jgi:aminopeptidase N
MTAISNVLLQAGDASSFDVITENVEQMPVGQAKFSLLRSYAGMLNKIRDTDKLKKGVDLIVEFQKAVPAAFRGRTDPVINNLLKTMVDQKQADGLADQAEYIRSKMGK